MSSFVILNGQLLPLEKARISPMDHGFLYGDGVYETLRTHEGKIFDFEAHYTRLQNSAKLLDIPVKWRKEELLKMCEELISKKENSPESRIRITLTRGENGYQFLGAKSPTLLVSISPLKDYSEERKGITLTSLQIERILPEAKTISMLVNNLAKQKNAKKNAFECILIDNEGFVTEGAVSNIIFIQEKTLYYTPREHTLAGTAQERVLETAKKIGINIQEKRFTISDLQKADEVMITNSLFDILPVKNIEEKATKNCPGKIYTTLLSVL